MVAEKMPSNELQARVEHYQKCGYKFMHPFDDPYLFYGYGRSKFISN